MQNSYHLDPKPQPRHSLTIGVDEVGRGCLAGPVMAAAVGLMPYAAWQPSSAVLDSKKLSPKKRWEIFQQIMQSSLALGVGMATVKEIEQHNILKASWLACGRAVEGVLAGLDNPITIKVLVDGPYKLPLNFRLNLDQQAIVGGDAKVPLIGAASIVAKVFRDAYMRDVLHVRWPVYAFDKHKGYGTRQHRAAIAQHGVTHMHRNWGCMKAAKRARGKLGRAVHHD